MNITSVTLSFDACRTTRILPSITHSRTIIGNPLASAASSYQLLLIEQSHPSSSTSTTNMHIAWGGTSLSIHLQILIHGNMKYQPMWPALSLPNHSRLIVQLRIFARIYYRLRVQLERGVRFYDNLRSSDYHYSKKKRNAASTSTSAPKRKTQWLPGAMSIFKLYKTEMHENTLATSDLILSLSKLVKMTPFEWILPKD